MNRHAVVVLVLVLVACNSRLDANSSAIDSCDGLRADIQDQIAGQCSSSVESGTATGASGYCSVCVSAGLFDYTASRAGVCTCAPLQFVSGSCAGTVTDSAIAGLINAADNQCVSFALPTVGPATDAAATADGATSVAEAGAEGGPFIDDAAAVTDAGDGSAD
jgi:hypothetical protein